MLTFKSMEKIAIASGKGGVGKTSLTLIIANFLKSKGYKVGLLDADIHGPNLVQLLVSKNDLSAPTNGKDTIQLIPQIINNFVVNSIDFSISKEDAAVWRGPLVSKVIKQLYLNTKWGELDYLLIDMPPGTGDTQLTFSQEIKIDGAIIVSTPQEVALLDVKRGIKMFDKLGVKILGLVDNMSYFIGDDNKKYKIFGEGGVRKTSEEYNKEFLGEIPIKPEIGKTSDNGKPIVEEDPNNEISKIYLDFANKIKSTYL